MKIEQEQPIRKEVILRSTYKSDEPERYGEKIMKETPLNICDPVDRKFLMGTIVKAMIGNGEHTVASVFFELQGELMDVQDDLAEIFQFKGV